MISKEALLTPQEGVIKLQTLNGQEVRIRKLKAREILTEQDDDDKKRLFPSLIASALVEPKLTYEEALEMNADTSKELAEKILEFNGMTEAISDVSKK